MRRGLRGEPQRVVAAAHRRRAPRRVVPERRRPAHARDVLRAERAAPAAHLGLAPAALRASRRRRLRGRRVLGDAAVHVARVDGAKRDGRAARLVLRAWYGATLKGWAEDAVDGDPFSQLRNRWSAVKLARDYARKKKLRYAFVLVLRWDYVVHADKWDPGCVLDGALRDARDLAPREHDADKMFAIPGKFVPCFFASIVEDHVVLGPDPRGANYSKRILRPPRCQWDACVEAMARAPRLSLPRARARRRARAGPRRGPGPPRDRALRRALDEQVRAQASGRRRPRARACRVDRAPRPQVPRTRPTPTSARSRRARPRTTAPRTTGATATPTGRTGTAASRLRTGRPPPPPPRRRPAARARA